MPALGSQGAPTPVASRQRRGKGKRKGSGERKANSQASRRKIPMYILSSVGYALLDLSYLVAFRVLVLPPRIFRLITGPGSACCLASPLPGLHEIPFCSSLGVLAPASPRGAGGAAMGRDSTVTHLFARCKAWSPQTKNSVEERGKACGWKHPQALRAILLGRGSKLRGPGLPAGTKYVGRMGRWK